jgi:hypothetical protein
VRIRSSPHSRDVRTPLLRAKLINNRCDFFLFGITFSFRSSACRGVSPTSAVRAIKKGGRACDSYATTALENRRRRAAFPENRATHRGCALALGRPPDDHDCDCHVLHMEMTRDLNPLYGNLYPPTVHSGYAITH